MSFALLLSAIIGSAVGDTLVINDARELIEFANSTNDPLGNVNCSGTTVMLGADIDFTDELSQLFEPIAKSRDTPFLGTFDGQGHAIRNLKVNSSLSYMGLLGYSGGSTIKNVVLDSSCSFTAQLELYNITYLGGIIGRCSAIYGPCNIQNNVNMATVSVIGDNEHNSPHIGGIAGGLSSTSNYGSTIKNCANYGNVTRTGESKNLYIGGISGSSWGASTRRAQILNSFNFGSITISSETFSRFYIGGITGSDKYITMENCVSYGNITSTSIWGTIKSISGSSEYSSLTNNFWSESIGYSAYSWGYSMSEPEAFEFDENFVLSERASIGDYNGTSLIEALNAYCDKYTAREYSRWALNREGNAISFVVNSNEALSLDSKIVLLPTLANNGKMWLDGWYTDSVCTSKLSDNELENVTKLYGKWEENENNYTITFDTRGGIPIEPVSFQFGSDVTLPNSPVRDGCTVGFWENEFGEKMEWSFAMPAYDIALSAVWMCTRISTIEEFMDFARFVNYEENSYNGTTVHLDADIDFAGGFSKKFEPIGKVGRSVHDETNYFQGTFDGQGHSIKNLVIESDMRAVGLFGFSKGETTIRNLVLDESCSVTSYCNDSDVSIGGVIGKIYASAGNCRIENVVNKGNTYFRADTMYRLHIGGIVGEIDLYYHNLTVESCTNNGTVANSGSCVMAYVGGIAGKVSDSYSDTARIRKCVNNGDVLNNGKAFITRIGGISGYSEPGVEEDCVNNGDVISNGASTRTINFIALLLFVFLLA